MSELVRIGALACSDVGVRRVFPAIGRVQGASLAAIASRAPEKARPVAASLATRACTYEELLADPAIDAVYVSVPTGLHGTWGRRVLEAGKHLLLEKTFTATLEEGRELLRLARARGLVAMEALMYLHHPLLAAVLRELGEGAIGEVQLVEAWFGVPARPAGDIRQRPELGGGAILDTLVYPLSFALLVLGDEAPTWHARVLREAGSEVDSRGYAQVDGRRASAQLGFGFGLHYRNAYRVWGSAGLLAADRVFTRPRSFAGAFEVSTASGVRRVEVSAADQTRLMLEAFVARVAGADPVRGQSDRELLGRLALIDAIRSAAV